MTFVPDEQTEFNTLRVCPMEISSLPEITDENIPVWEEMSETKEYKCIICGKQKLLKLRYADHVMFDHMADLLEPVIEEFSLARIKFLDKFENSTPEEQEKAYWDYDSETGKKIF